MNWIKSLLLEDEEECGWARKFLEFILGSGLHKRVVKWAANPLLTAGILLGFAIIACGVSIVANTHVEELIVSVTGSALGTQRIDHGMRFGYLLEPNFFLWLTCFLPAFAGIISYSLVLLARALRKFTMGQHPRLRWRYQTSANLNKITFSRIMLVVVFVVLPIFSCYFQQVALAKAIQLPRIFDDSTFVKSFDFGNTQAPTLGALVERFNRLKTDAARFSAIEDRTPEVTAISEELSTKLPNAHLVLKDAIQRGDLSLQMSLPPQLGEERFNNISSYIAFPAYVAIVYALQGMGWTLAIFGIYLLASQFLVWFRLIKSGDLELLYESKEKDFGLKPLTDFLSVFYILVVIGASYVLLQSVTCEKGGSIEFRVFDIVLVAVGALIFVAGLIAIEIETRNKRGKYIRDKKLKEAVKEATTEKEQRESEERLERVEAQRFLRFSIGSVAKYGLPVLALAVYPIWPSLDRQINEIWNSVRDMWIATVCSIFHLT